MIFTIDLLETTECGPESNIGEFYQEVFLNQGSLDGACGPYSLFMGLLTLGLVDRNEVTSFYTDGRTRLGKLINKLNNDYFSLFKNGTHLTDLESILIHSFGSKLNTEVNYGKGKNVVKFVLEHLKKNHPTVIGVNFPGGAHWMLAIGYETNIDNKAIRLLLLDPSGNKPIVSSWNSILDLKSTQSGMYPYKWWTPDRFIQFEEAIAMWNK